MDTLVLSVGERSSLSSQNPPSFVVEGPIEDLEKVFRYSLSSRDGAHLILSPSALLARVLSNTPNENNISAAIIPVESIESALRKALELESMEIFFHVVTSLFPAIVVSTLFVRHWVDGGIVGVFHWRLSQRHGHVG